MPILVLGSSSSGLHHFLYLPILPYLAKVKHPLHLYFVELSTFEAHMAKILGIEGMNPQQLANELQSGARFVQYQYCVSALVITFKRGTDIYFIRADESPTVKGLAWTLLTLLAGWWGIPWGPIYTVQSLWVNLRGGHDMTPEAASALRLPIDKSTLYPEARKAAGA